MLADDHRALLTARVDPRTRGHIGTKMSLSVDASRFHLFDPTTKTRLEQSRAVDALATV